MSMCGGSAPGERSLRTMPEIPMGTKSESNLLVTADVAVKFLGLEAARVLSTPHLIANLEFTARDAVRHLLARDQDTVGTHVDVRHLAATPVGMKVTFRAEVVGVEDRRVRFNVEAFDEQEKIAEGTHERFIVNVERFTSRLAEKAARQTAAHGG